jgi:hypothetical protein
MDFNDGTGEKGWEALNRSLIIAKMKITGIMLESRLLDLSATALFCPKVFVCFN